MRRLSGTLTLAAGALLATLAVAPTGAAADTAPCGTATGAPPAVWDHVVVIMMENKAYPQVIGDQADAPYINSLAAQCGLATNFTTGVPEASESLPHYLALTSGSTQGVNDNKPPGFHPIAAPSIFSLLGAGRWRSLEESMPKPCDPHNAVPYAVRHNPAAYYTSISAQCNTQDVALGAIPDLSAAFTFVTPNLEDDMHRTADHSTVPTEVQAGDTWLANELPLMLDSPEYLAGTTAIFLTWDEGTSRSTHIPTVVVSPYTSAGTVSDTAFTQYSLLRTWQEMLDVSPLLGHAGDTSTPSMRAAFGLG